ncbi:MAG: hypothetical protein K2K38_02695 [Clostridia bacterium]|nr:hypothetical protein [Clostridia bacterium]
MEKFALLDFLKAFQSLTAKTGGEPVTEKEQTPPPSAPPSPQPPFYERNVMADVIARHEEVVNRIRNKRSV